MVAQRSWKRNWEVDALTVKLSWQMCLAEQTRMLLVHEMSSRADLFSVTVIAP